MNMNDIQIIESDYVDDLFGKTDIPTLHSPLDALVFQYEKIKAEIISTAELMSQCTVLRYFEDGDKMQNDRAQYRASYSKESGMLSLDTSFWSKAIDLTDVKNYMPAPRLNEWSEMIRTGYLEKKVEVQTRFGPEKKTEKTRIPAFEIDTVKSTLHGMLALRQQFFAERIDGLWSALSKEHLTNQPQAFGKRLILRRVIDSWDSLDTNMASHLHDLRVVISRYMGRDQPDYRDTNIALSQIVKDVVKGDGSGKWHVFDGGAWSVRMYKVGTAHLLIHPSMAWRLNAVLASLHPMAIPSEFRQKPAKKAKEFTLVHNLVPFEVIRELGYAKSSCGANAYELSFYALSKPMSKSCRDILLYLGGVNAGKTGSLWAFDYDAHSAIHEITQTGLMPEHRAFQYYPTNEDLAQEAVDLAEINETDSTLEPSAGQAGIAKFLPKDRTTCVEISALHCKVLEAYGLKTIQADFLAWFPEKGFDKIVMNPPFSDSRAENHVKKAASLLNKGGILVSILPASFKGKTIVDGMVHEYSSVRPGEFKGANVSVVLLKLY